MSIQIYVDAYSGYKANERPIRFHLDDDTYDIASIEDRWQEPNAEYFKVRSVDGKLYLLRYDERADDWTLQSGFDGDEVLARPGIELITVEPKAIREAESKIAGCERCRGDEAHLPFDWILADVLNKRGPYDFVLSEVAHCPNCRAEITEKTWSNRRAELRSIRDRAFLWLSAAPIGPGHGPSPRRTSQAARRARPTLPNGNTEFSSRRLGCRFYF